MGILKRIAIVLVTLILAAGLGFYFYLMSVLPAQEERLAFNNERIIEEIDNQLKDVDIEIVKSKSNLIEQKSIEELKELLSNGKLTHEELVAYYLLRIKEYDQNPLGNNAVSEINKEAIKEAREFDKNKSDKLLAGIPVLVKENINTKGMPTSAGSYALKDFVTSEDAPVVTKLKENGAIILGKTNLSEMAFFTDRTTPSGYSSKKGQTLNPFGQLKISASGSSTGSAVAIATDLAATTLGTETEGSIVSPSSVNSAVGFKPTRNKISGEGVIPLSYSLDTVGVISKSVKDAYVTYKASINEDINISFDKDFLKGKRIGIAKYYDEEDVFFDDLKQTLENLGATVVVFRVDSSSIDTLFVILNDFEKDFNSYLEKYNAPIKSLKELVEYNKQDKKQRSRYGQRYLIQALEFNKKDDAKAKGVVQLANNILNKAIDDNNLDILVAKNEEQAGLGAVSGGPEISVPFGIYEGTPTGATFFGKPGTDNEVLKFAYAFEVNTNKRVLPKLQKN